jgi:hypothetical protein
MQKIVSKEELKREEKEIKEKQLVDEKRRNEKARQSNINLFNRQLDDYKNRIIRDGKLVISLDFGIKYTDDFVTEFLKTSKSRDIISIFMN